MVAGLVEKGEVCPGTLLYFDNLFTSMKLLNWLSERGLGGTGTLRQNRVKAIPIPAKKEVEKGFKRGESQVVFCEDVSVVVWKDNKPVYMGTNVHKKDENFSVRRWRKVDKLR